MKTSINDTENIYDGDPENIWYLDPYDSLSYWLLPVLQVVEESRYPPQAEPLRVTVVAYEDRWSGGELGRVLAWDLDPYDSLSYELLPASALFAIDPRLGVIVASSGLDAGRYLLNVSVSDGKVSTQVLVEVLVLPLWEEDLQYAVSLR